MEFEKDVKDGNKASQDIGWNGRDKIYADLAASNTSLERDKKYDPVEKLKLIPDRFLKSPLF